MNELYWITRLDAICVILIVVMSIAVVAMAIGFMIWSVSDDIDEQARGHKVLRLSLITFLFSTIVYIFVPDTKQALIIYGVGGTIDYVKDNDKCKQIPNKVIDALDKYLEYLNKEDEK